MSEQTSTQLAGKPLHGYIRDFIQRFIVNTKQNLMNFTNPERLFYDAASLETRSIPCGVGNIVVCWQ
jgi:hypothetical protein